MQPHHIICLYLMAMKLFLDDSEQLLVELQQSLDLIFMLFAPLLQFLQLLGICGCHIFQLLIFQNQLLHLITINLIAWSK